MESDSKKKNFVVLVIDRWDERFGELGKLEFHDRTKEGDEKLHVEGKNYYVRFENGQIIAFPDGLSQGVSPSPVRVFYRHKDHAGETYDLFDRGPESLKKVFHELEIGGLEVLARGYYTLFRETLQ